MINQGLEELRLDRKEWVDSSRKNDFEEGINHLLTELYPDNAHFIYEVLQNAEDARDKTNPVSQGASIVRFTLNNDSLELEHNGQGLFTLADVRSITSIGKSTKREDPTSIGKFGVGFKAVFAYTNTPEIHSGDFHFCIRDLLVPETEGVQHPRMEGLETRFIFPFDNPKKPREQAVDEVQSGLLALGNNTLLFLNHIHKIEYLLPNGSLGTLERIPHQEGRIEIRTTQPDGKETISHWLLFKKDVEVTDEKGEPKNCRIAIAYSLVKEENKKMAEKWKIVPLDHGQTSIYFPASEEKPNLKFHLHAPFASTVARDVVRKGVKANEILRDHLSDLVVESLHNIRDQGMLTVAFLAVLPNHNDDLPEFYEPIRNAIVHAFQKQDLTPTRSGEHRPAGDLYRGPEEIADVFEDEGFWVANVPKGETRGDQFIRSLEINEFGWEELVSIFKPRHDNPRDRDEEQENYAHKERVEAIIQKMSDTRLMDFYALLGKAIKELGDDEFSEADELIDASNWRIVRVSSENGDNHVKPGNAYFPSNENIDIPPGIPFVKREVYLADRSKRQKNHAKSFLENIGVRVYGAKEDIEIILKQYEYGGKAFPVETHLKHIKQFKDYWLENRDSIEMFQPVSFLKGQGNSEGNEYLEASELYLDLPYQETGLAELSRIHEKEAVWGGYKEELPESILKDFVDFLKSIGVMHGLKVERVSTMNNPNKNVLRKDYYQYNIKKTKTFIDEDYSIINIEKYLAAKSALASRLIWNALIHADRKSATASFRPNQQYITKESESQLVFHLSHQAWIPDKEGIFRRPEEMTKNDLRTDFPYGDRNGLLTVISFGERAKKHSEEYCIRNETAKGMGFSCAEEAEEWAKFSSETGVTLGELRSLVTQRQRASPQPEESVQNPERRRQGVLERRDNAPTKDSVTRERSIQPRATSETLTAKAYLRTKYMNTEGQLICQCCQSEMPFKVRDNHYFEAVQCVRGLDHHYYENRLALCPTCAAMYKHAIETDHEEIRRSIIKHDVSDTASFAGITIGLAGRKVNLRFVGTHWFDLKTVLSG